MVQVRVLSNDLAEIAARMVRDADALAEDTAQDLVSAIDQTAPAHVRGHTTVSHDGVMKRTVNVGDKYDESFDAALQEYGSVVNPARPYVTPAAERARGKFEAELSRIGRRG